MSKYTLEKSFKIFNDETGDYIEVREDPDGLGMIEITNHDHTGNEESTPVRIDSDENLVTSLITALKEIENHISSRVER